MTDALQLPEVFGLKVARDVTVGDEAKGEVVAHFATMDEVDNDRQVFPLGSIPDGMKTTVSSYSHDTVIGQMLNTGVPDQAPVGKGVIRVEGKKAIAYLNYFMETQRGREAFLTVKAMGADQAWSFSYRQELAPANAEWKAKGAKEMIVRVGPLLDGAMEISPVKQPGGKSTGTVEVKQAAPPVAEVVAPVIPAAVADPVLEGRVARVKRSLAR